MAIAIDKEHREIAKREGLYLFQIMVDGRHLKIGYGTSSSSGACTKEQADKLREWIREYDSSWRGEVTMANTHHHLCQCSSCASLYVNTAFSAGTNQPIEASIDALQHVDFRFDGMDCFKVCGLVRPADGWKKACKGPTELSLRDDEPLIDAEVDAFLEEHKDDPVDAARAERIEWKFREKLGRHWALQGREYLDNYNQMLAEESRRTAATVGQLYSGTIVLIESMVRAIETLAIKPATPSLSEVEAE